MLTIKHIETSGHESLNTAINVSFQPRNAGGISAPPTLFAFGVPGPNEGARHDGVIQYGDGRVFVMNDNGKTVAMYDLGGDSTAPR